MMGDIMYFHQVLKQTDTSSFIKAVVKEVNGHVDSKHWELIKYSNVPKNVETLSSLWAMCCKCNITHSEITK